MHPVLGLLVGDELTLRIPSGAVKGRQLEFNRAITRTSRAEVVKALMAFSGIELIDYDSAVIEHKSNGTCVTVRSRDWGRGQPR